MTSQSQTQQSTYEERLANDADPLTNDAAMDFPCCIVCAFDIVDEGCGWQCGHATHKGCFPVFLELTNLDCDFCASAQWCYGNGNDEATEELTEGYQHDEYPYEEDPQYDQE